MRATAPSVEALLASSRRLYKNTGRNASTDGTVAPRRPEGRPPTVHTGDRPSPLGATIPSVEAFLASSRRLVKNTNGNASTDGTEPPGDPRKVPRQATGDRPGFEPQG